MKDSVKVTWFGHACFTIEADNYRLVFDPYADNYVPGLPKLSLVANQIECSHLHEDHCAKSTVQLLKSAEPSPFLVHYLQSYHDHDYGLKRGKNIITIVEYHQLKVVHFGDQGCLPSEEQLAQMKFADVVMIPVGGFYTIDAKEAKQIIDAIQPTIVLPMHYRSDQFGFDKIARIDSFLSQYDNVRYYDSNQIVVHKDCESQIAILQLKTNEND